MKLLFPDMFLLVLLEVVEMEVEPEAKLEMMFEVEMLLVINQVIFELVNYEINLKNQL